MTTLYTIGHTQKTLERFVRLLQEAGVDAVVDVRLRNTSQLAGYAKRDDLAFLLRKLVGIEYEHRPELAPTAEILDAYKTEGDWAAYEQGFWKLLAEREAQDLGRELLGRYQHPCLLCSEPTPDQCHRRLIAEWWIEHVPEVEVVHL